MSSAITVRLPDDLDRKITRAAKKARKNRSEIIRDRLTESFRAQEQEEFMTSLYRAAEALAKNPEARREGLEIAEEGLEDWLESIEKDERAAGIDPNKKWWS